MADKSYQNQAVLKEIITALIFIFVAAAVGYRIYMAID